MKVKLELESNSQNVIRSSKLAATDQDDTIAKVSAATAIADDAPNSGTASARIAGGSAVTRTSLTSVHALRGIAMLAVVSHHVLGRMTVRLSDRKLDGSLLQQYPVLAEFACGVDIFFVISGFLLLMICKPYLDRRRTIGNFILHRVFRIWPLYAIVTCLVLGHQYLKTSGPGLPLPFDFQPMRLAGILFIPSFDDEGLLRPIYKAAWTLSYEIWFYGCLTTAIAFAATRRELFLGVSALILGGIVLGHNLPDGSVAATFFSEPLAIEFLLGAGVYVTLQSRKSIPFGPGFWLAVGFAWLIAFATVNADEGWRLGTRGIPATLFLIGMLKLEGKVSFPSWIIAISNASYSIFLTHGFLLPKLTEVAVNLFDGRVPQAFLGEISSIFILLMSALFGMVCFKLVEKPLAAKCRARIGE